MDDYSTPILPGRGATDYERYLRTDELLSLQKTPDEMGHRDELLFQTVHQTSELWLKLAGFEIETATGLVEQDEALAATRLVSRAAECLSVIVDGLHVLEQMSPKDYQGVRRMLGHGAGFDSPGFVRLHSLAPALGQAFDALIARRGLTLIEVYEREREREIDELFRLAEALIAFDERVLLWRFHHLKLVERIIGGRVIGTQGTPVEVLGKRIQQALFPALWEVRNQLTERAALPPDDESAPR